PESMATATATGGVSIPRTERSGSAAIQGPTRAGGEAMDASRRRAGATLAAALCGVAAPDARACGELMLRSLGAMRFHAFVTRIPAPILLYSGPVASQWPEEVNAKLHAQLEKAGHSVRQARGAGELGQMLAASRYDVLIAYADDMLGASGPIAGAARGP